MTSVGREAKQVTHDSCDQTCPSLQEKATTKGTGTEMEKEKGREKGREMGQKLEEGKKIGRLQIVEGASGLNLVL